MIDTDSGHHKKVESEDYHYASLFSKIEKRFNCHLNYDQKKNAHNIDDVIYVTQHYFHTYPTYSKGSPSNQLGSMVVKAYVKSTFYSKHL